MQDIGAATKAPEEMTADQLRSEVDRLSDIAERRYHEGKPIKFLCARCSALLDELERRGLLGNEAEETEEITGPKMYPHAHVRRTDPNDPRCAYRACGHHPDHDVHLTAGDRQYLADEDYRGGV